VGFLALAAVSAFAQGGVTLRRPTPPTVERNFVAASVHALPELLASSMMIVLVFVLLNNWEHVSQKESNAMTVGNEFA
jgi:hypothetical protein